MSLSQRINGALRRVPAGLLYVLVPLLAIWWFYQGLTGGLGPEPIKSLEHLYGEFALQLLIVGLAVTPLRVFAGLNLIKFRRAIGLLSFLYVSLHLSVWLFLDVQIWSEIWADILKRPYITIGMIGFLALIPLAATSNNKSLRKLGPLRWRRLHKLTYPALVLAVVHNVMVQKVWEAEALIYLSVVVVLLGLRVVDALRKPMRRAAAA